MRRTFVALVTCCSLFVLAPAAQAASTQQIVTAPVPSATDGLDEIHSMVTHFTYTDAAAGEENCAYWSTQYRAIGATDATGDAWRDVPMWHGTRAWVPLAGLWGTTYGAKDVQFRLSPQCNPASTVVTKRVQYLAPHSLDPQITAVVVPATVTGDTVSVSITAVPGPYDAPKDLHVRFATENGIWLQHPNGSELKYTPVMNAPVSAGVGAKGLFVLVVDGQRDSNIKFVRFTRVAGVTTPTTPATPVPPVTPPSSSAPTTPSSPPANTAPVLSSISTPLRVIGSRVIVTVAASDDIAVTRIRFATEAGKWTAWHAYTTNRYSLPTSAGYGYKGLFVQVQDAKFATSKILYRKYTRVRAS